MRTKANFGYVFLGASILFSAGVIFTPQMASAAKPKRAKVVFNRDIRPIISKCLACHGHDKKAVMAGLILDTRAGAIAKLSSGNHAIVPGQPKKSELLNRVFAAKDSPLLMPPADSNKTISSDEKALLKQWIEEGAEYTEHWAFVKPVRPPLPEVQNKAWPKNEIDRFILAKLEEKGLKPSPEADRPTLIRRVTLDLIGLPPSPADVRAFVADKSPNAYEKVVDRLLASPRYAERMAMDWMDYSRYADSNGYQADYERYQWRWRDWVLDAFNKNMPYNQFTLEQLAGDMLPNATDSQKIATGFNRNHRINTEGGVVPEEWRIETVIDRVETTSTVWLGLTSGCARCHDHKYDPISQKEFYGMFSYFNNVPETGSGEERPVNHPPFMKAPMTGQVIELTRRAQEAKKLEAEVQQRAMSHMAVAENWVLPEIGAMPSLKEGVSAQYTFKPDAPAITVKGSPKFELGKGTGAITTGGDNYLDLGNVGDFDSKSAFSYAVWLNPMRAFGAPVAKMNSGKDYQGWDLFLDGGRVMAHIISSWPSNALKVSSRKTIPEKQWSHVAMSYDGSGKSSGIKLYINGENVPVDVEADSLTGTIRNDSPLTVGRRSDSNNYEGSVEDLTIYHRAITGQEVVSLSGAHPAKPILAITANKRTPAQKEMLAKLWSRENDPEYTKLDDERAVASQKYAEIDSMVPTVMVMEELKKPRQAHILIRGEYDKLGKSVPPAVPAALPPIPKGLPNNRLGFAKWVVDPSNPLTARVTVNRFWDRFFGTGIVATIEDFGTRAEYPSHPELLDWLATEFTGKGWNVKGIIKEMVMSATYRQSSTVSAKVLKVDPANRLYARGPRFRLPAEVIRDQVLMAAGLLANRMGGPSVRPYQPEGIWDETNVYGNLRNYKPDIGEGRYRRSLYTIWKRTAAPPNMTLFDSSTRETCRVRRARTDTPLQALVLMNDVTFVEAARGLAQRTMRESDKTADGRIRYMMQMLAGRSPTAAETTILRNGLQRRLAKYAKDPVSAAKLLKVGDLPIDTSVPAGELAAYTLLASTIMNLDEVVTKE